MLLEPMFLATPAGAAFARTLAPLIERYEAGDAEGTVHGFLALVGERSWRATIDQTVPGGITQAVQDAATFFETEVPGVSNWTFGPERAAAITDAGAGSGGGNDRCLPVTGLCPPPGRKAAIPYRLVD